MTKLSDSNINPVLYGASQVKSVIEDRDRHVNWFALAIVAAPTWKEYGSVACSCWRISVFLVLMT